MKQFVKCRFRLLSLCLFVSGLILPVAVPASDPESKPASAPPVLSDLWGENGEKWNPETSRLRDFTNVGYKEGNEPIPMWPVGVSVTDFGAVPNDKVDDSQAFLDAIEACPPEHAVLVPRGYFIILQQIRVKKDFVVIRGEDLYESVLFFPKNMIEIDPPTKRDEFLKFVGTTHQGVENLSFVFREQQKMGHWEFRGADAISFAKSVEDSWARNLYIKNADHGIQVSGKNISVLSVLFDHSIIRPDIIGSSGITRWVGHVGIGMTARYSLFHNIRFTGKYFHDFDIINVPNHNVVSNVKGHEMALHHHGQGARYNLYTNVDVGTGKRALGGLKDSQRQQYETHWRIFGDQTLNAGTVPQDTQNDHVFVGYDTDIDTKITDTLWFEKVDPARLHPQNIYLAQMKKAGKPLPQGTIPDLPALGPQRVIRIPQLKGAPHYSFDLSELELDTVARARLQVHMARSTRPPFTYSAYAVVDGEKTGEPLDSFDIKETDGEIPMEFDVTPLVQRSLEEGSMVTIKLQKSKTGTYNGYLGGSDRGNAPLLIIEKAPDPVPGPPSPPTGLRTAGGPGHILLDWADSPEPDVRTYNVYRTHRDSFGTHLTQPIATGLLLSEFADVSHKENRSNSDLPAGKTFRYVVTAVDTHFNESGPSEMVSGIPLKR